MKQLDKDWFCSGTIDFELKKYTLLAYLQEVNKKFSSQKLYPPLSELIAHFEHLKEFEKLKNTFTDEMGNKDIIGLDLEKQIILYQQNHQQREELNELDDIIAYALPKVKSEINIGVELFEEVEYVMSIEPIGIVPSNLNSGFVFLSAMPNKQADVYRYEYFNNLGALHLNWKYLYSFRKTLVNTFENIKLELMKKYTDTCDATFLIQSEMLFPIEETMMPIAKRMFLRTLNNPI